MQENGGRLECLEEQVRRQLQESTDYYYTEFLKGFMEKVRQQKYQTDLLQEELNRVYALYLSRNPSVRASREPGAAQQPAVPQPSAQQLSEPVPRPSAQQPSGQEPVPRPSAQQLPGQESVPQPSAQQPSGQEPVPQPSAGGQFGAGSVRGTPEGRRTGAARGAFPASPHYGSGYTGVVYQPVPPQPKNKKNTEFTVGVVVFSIIGVFFLLTSFVMLGIKFMDGFVRGMSLYGLAMAILLFSELVVFRRSRKLGMALSSLGVGGLYLSTVLNYLTLHNFNGPAAMGITALITAGTILLSKKRNSWLIRVIGMAACFLCFLPVWTGIGTPEFLTLTAVLVLVNIMCIFIPAGDYTVALGIFQMVFFSVFSQIFVWRASWCGVRQEVLAVFALCTLAVVNLIFLRTLCTLLSTLGGGAQEKGEGSLERTGTAVAFLFSAFFPVMELVFSIYNADGPVWLRHVSAAALAAVSLIFFLLNRKNKEKWYLYYMFSGAVFLIYLFSGSRWEISICAAGLLILSKLLTRVEDLRVSEVVVTSVVCLTALICNGWPHVLVLVSALLFSVVFIRRWQTCYEMLLTFTLVLLALIRLPSLLRLPVAVGILFVGILLFHNVKRFKGKSIAVFNYTALAVQGVCFLLLAHPIYRGAFITYMMMLVFGLATVILCFQEKYSMDFRKKHLVLCIFLTYMALLSRTGIPILTSVILMILALCCVGTGFVIRDRSIRIYGMSLSLFVCGKILFYDFIKTASVQKIVLFFVVGVIALVISGIYIVLEKKYSRDKPEQGKAGEI